MNSRRTLSVFWLIVASALAPSASTQQVEDPASSPRFTASDAGPKASDPIPPDGATGVTEPVLQWTPGTIASFHDVYFGTSPNLGPADLVTCYPLQTTVYWHAPGLTPAMTYYWRINEVKADGTTYVGDVWHFTTAEILEGPVYYVDANTGSDDNGGSSAATAFATIQHGIDLAADGDTVLVYPGVYREQIDFLGKAITVRSAQDAAVLEAPQDSAVSFHRNEGPQSILENFVVRNSFIGIFATQARPTLRHLTVVNNRYGLEAYAGAAPDVSHCIFWYNTGDDVVGCQARHSCIERGGQGNLATDPLFADPDAGDYHLMSERGRYWPQHDVWVLDNVTSPCIDAGDPAADYSSEPIPNGGRINIGASGGTAYASMSDRTWLDGDVNHNNVVDMMDFARLAENWLKAGPGRLNELPQVEIASAGGSCCPCHVSIKVDAHDPDGLVVKVEFFVNGDKVGQDKDGTDGWQITWSDCSFGTYEAMARATDNEGATSVSAPVGIRVGGIRR